MSNYNQLIFEAIASASKSDSCDLFRIISYVDGRNKSIVSYEELVNGLTDLIKEGKILEVEKHKFIENRDQDLLGSFSGLSEDEYNQACKDYYQWFEEEIGVIDDDDDELNFRKLVIKWKLPDGRASTEKDFEVVDAMVAELDNVLDPEIAGIFDYGEEEEFIEVPIFGRQPDEGTDLIYTVVRDIFKSTGCPSGSYIIRFYEETNREEVSDIIN